jgi:hypothetical protein
MAPERISPHEAYTKVLTGKARLICAYEDEEKCKDNMLDGAESLADLKANVPSSRDEALIFYCA